MNVMIFGVTILSKKNMSLIFVSPVVVQHDAQRWRSEARCLAACSSERPPKK
jgi:hypothetical protein